VLEIDDDGCARSGRRERGQELPESGRSTPAINSAPALCS